MSLADGIAWENENQITAEELKNLESAAWSYDGHVTNGSMEKIRRIVAQVAARARLDAMKDTEGTEFREYFRSIVHNIEHLNREAALNTARAALIELDRLEKQRGAELQKAVTG